MVQNTHPVDGKSTEKAGEMVSGRNDSTRPLSSPIGLPDRLPLKTCGVPRCKERTRLTSSDGRPLCVKHGGDSPPRCRFCGYFIVHAVGLGAWFHAAPVSVISCPDKQGVASPVSA